MPDMSDFDETLRAIRDEIDGVDAQLHQLLIERTTLIEKVGKLKRDLPVKIRPAREAQIAYTLVERHRGPFPKRDLIRIWREMIMATLSIEGPFSTAVYAAENADGYWDLARDHFCNSLALTRHTSVQQVINAVMTGDATTGVLPVPSRDDEKPWWPHLMGVSQNRPKVIFRLPFTGSGNGRSAGMEAIVICPVDQEETGRDRSFFAFETENQIPLDTVQKALRDVDLPPYSVLPWYDANAEVWLYLVEVDAYVADEDRRIRRFTDVLKRPVGRIVSLGGYAKPLTEKELSTASDEADTTDT